MQDLGTLGGDQTWVWHAVTYDGRMVFGASRTSGGEWHAFRWTPERGIEDLNVLYASIIPAGWTLCGVNDCSRDGRFLVGWAEGPGGVIRAFLLDTGTGGLINQPPSTPTLLSPPDNATVSPTPTFKLKTTDPDGDQVKFRIEAKQGGITKEFETAFVASGAEATYTVPSNQAFIDGQVTWKAKAIDRWGAESGWSDPRSFNVRRDAPDLVPKDLLVDPTAVMPGGKVTVSVKVFNQGRVKAKASKTRVRLSQSAEKPSPSDPLLAEFDTPELNVNQYVTHRKEVTIPSDTQPGDYYVWVIVDADGTVGQSDETNDRIKVALKVEETAQVGTINVTVFDVAVDLDTGRIDTSKALSGVTVKLIKDGQQIAYEKTGNDGRVQFSAQAGTYTVQAFFVDSKTGVPLRSEKVITFSEGGSVATTLHLGLSLVRKLWEIKGSLERLKFTFYGFSFNLPSGTGYNTQKVNEAVIELARETKEIEKALQALERLLLALELSNRFLRDAESLSSEFIGAVMDIALVAWAAVDLIGKVKDTIKAMRLGFDLERLVNVIVGKLIWMHFKALSLAFKLAKQNELAVFADEIANVIREKAEKGEAFRGKDYAIESLGKQIVLGAGGMLFSRLYVSKTQENLDMAAGWARGKKFSGSWQGAYERVFSLYTQIHKENEGTIQKSASLRAGANFASRDAMFSSGNHRLAHILGLGVGLAPDAGVIKGILGTMAGILEGISIGLNAKAAVSCYERFSDLSIQDLPKGINLAFNPGRMEALDQVSKVEDEPRLRIMQSRLRAIAGDGTQRYIAAIASLKEAISKGEIGQIMNSLDEIYEADKALMNCWERILSVIAVNSAVSDQQDLQDHPVMRAIEQISDVAAKQIGFYAAILSYLLEIGKTGRISRQLEQELLREIDRVKENVQQAQQIIQQVSQNLPPVPSSAILNIVDFTVPKMKVGQPTQVKAIIANDGEIDASNIMVKIRVSGGTVDQPTKIVSSLPAGGSVEVVWTVTPQDNEKVVSAIVSAEAEKAFGDSEIAVTKVLQRVNAIIPSGLAMVSFPFTPEETDPAKLLNIPADQLKIAWWNPERGGYEYYASSNSAMFSIAAGRAYWVKLPEGKQVSTYGEVDPRSQVFLMPGWNMVGLPNNSPVHWSVTGIMVLGPEGSIETLEEAEKAGWVTSYAWAYEPGQGYRLVYDANLLPGVIGELEPGRGYWIWAKVPCVLQLPEQTTQIRSHRQKSITNDWHLLLRARVGEASAEAILGVSQGSRGLSIGLPPEPPEGSSNVQVIVLNNGAPLAVDVRNNATRQQVWDVVVKFGTRDGGRGTRKEVTLTWDGVGYAPKDVSLTLVDLATGTRRYMRTQTEYRFVPNEGETERRFKVIAELSNERPLRIVGLKAIPMRGQGVVIEFALTKPAQVQAEVLTLTGRKVTVVEAQTPRSSGTHRIVWQGVNKERMKVSSSVYLIRLIATDEEGRQVQASLPVRLR